MSVDEVVARERAVAALGFVEDRDVRLDPALVNQPGEVLGRTIGRIGRQPFRPQPEALPRAIDHPLLRRHLGLADCRGHLDVHDDGVLQVDQVVGAVGKESQPTIRSRPT